MNHTNNNLIVNLTNYELEPPLQSMLSKGLKFVPTPDRTCLKTIVNSFKQFRRSMYIHYHFRNSPNIQPSPFKSTSTWKPPLPDNPNLISYICSVAESIHHTFRQNPHDHLISNLTEEETNFLATYNIHNDKYVIKPADKGGAIVIWSITDYEKEALSQLNDNKYYEHIPANSTTVISQQATKVTKCVKDLFKFGDINYKTLQQLIPPSPPRTPIFYLLPKIHKPGNPGRPIISGCDSPTDRLSSFVDFHLKPLCSSLPSYIKDTNHFLQTIFNLETPLPPNTIIATIDVKSLYTNIPHNEGTNAVLESLDTKHGRMWPFRKIIHQFLEYILKENYFTFQDQLYLQKHGTAMGTKMAPSFANIFMGALEQALLSSSPNHLIPLLWKRFIDDIFLIWTHGEESFLSFIQYLNSFHPTIKFKVTHSTRSVDFLDTTIYITPQNTLQSTLYIKPTDRMPLLHQTSHHPNACKKGLIYSQMLRYRRIITDDKEFEQKAQNLRVALIGRGYKDKDILPHIKKASTFTQSQLLATTPPSNNSRTLPFVIPYNPDLTPLHHILKQHWQYIENDPVLSQIWPNQPVMAYQRHKNFKEHFVRTKFNKAPISQQHNTS